MQADWHTSHDAARLADLDPDYIRKPVRAGKIVVRKWSPFWQVQSGH